MSLVAAPAAALLPIRLRPAAPMSLICFPYAGAGAQVYASWAASLPPALEILAFQPPGRGTRLRDPLLTSIADLTSDAVRAITPVLDRPFAFFGHSMGALLAFEVARRLRDTVAPQPRQLLLSGAASPDAPPLSPAIYALSRDEFLSKIRDFNGTPPAVLENPELLEIVLPILRADFEACDTYRFVDGPPLDVPIAVLGGHDDPDAPPAYLEAWGKHTTRPLTVWQLPGGHFYLHTSVDQFFDRINRELHAGLADVGAEKGHRS